jgi:NADPH2 dehydrogenase
MSSKLLISPMTLGSLKLKNRIVMPPMVIWQSDESAEVKNAHLEHYNDRSGPGLMIVEATTVAQEGRLASTQLGIFDDRHIPGLKKLALVIQKTGAVSGIQIHHAGGKASLETNYGLMPLVPSREGVPGEKECRELTVVDIKRIIRDFAAGAERAVAAGFEIIELHGAHGYLGSQFLSPKTNLRKDEYGGSLENRQRFILEVYKAVTKVVGSRAQVYFRLGVADKDGLNLEEGIDTVKQLESLGMKLVNVSCGIGFPEGIAAPESPYSDLMHLAIEVKKHTSMTVIGVGGVIAPEMAESLVESGGIDLVAAGKAHLADPQWTQKIVTERVDEIDTCLQCGPCRWFKDPSKCPVGIKRRKNAGKLKKLA